MKELEASSSRRLSPCALEGIASRIDAACRLLQCTRWLQHSEHRPICDVAVRQLDVYLEAVRLARDKLSGAPMRPSQALVSDVAASLPWQPLESLEVYDLIDAYVNARLIGVVASIRMMESSCLEGSDPVFLEVGNVMFECLHWIETARRDLAELAAQDMEALEAA